MGEQGEGMEIEGDTITRYGAKVKEKRQTLRGKNGNEKHTAISDVLFKAKCKFVVKLNKKKKTLWLDDEVSDVIKKNVIKEALKEW